MSPITVTTERDVIAGIDWGGSYHQLRLVDGNGDRVLQRRVTQDVEGFAALDQIPNSTAGLRIAIE